MTGANTLLRPVGSISEYRHFYHWIWELVDTLELMCKSISSIKANYFYFILLEVQQEWSNLTGQHRRSILRSLAHACAIPSGDTPNPFIIPTRSLDVVLDLVGQYYNATSHIIREGTTVDRYISAVRLMKEGKDKKLGDNINRSIQQLLLAHIATINLSMSSAEDEILPLLERLSKIISSEPLALCDQERDKFIQVLAHIYGHEGTRGAKETVGKTLLTGLQYSHAQDDQLPDRFVGSVVAIDEYLSRSISLERYYEIISCVTSVLSEHDPCTPEASLRETLIHIKDPVISFWIAQHCPEDWEFEALVNPDSRKWNKDVGHALSLIGLCKMFLRTIIIDGPPSIRQYVVRILELLSMNEEEWLQILSSPALNNILEWYHNGGYGYNGDILNRVSRFSWFNDQFRIANGLSWLSRIGLSDPRLTCVVLQLLVDQIIFESANMDINGPLECSFICLQTLRGFSPIDRGDNNSGWNDELSDGISEGSSDRNDDSDGQELSHLQEALMWILHNATTMRNTGALPPSDGDFKAPEFATIAIRKVEDGLASPGQPRSFEFVKDMSDEEWEEWSGRIKSMVMGINLGGLEPGPMYARHRFLQDPDGV
ncbi:hypothetical protein CPB86DRAFT_803216, partial [Serendipita vermifera]